MSADLPWDRWGEPAEPELPYNPPPRPYPPDEPVTVEPYPVPDPPVDWDSMPDTPRPSAPPVATPIPTGNYQYQEHFAPPPRLDWSDALEDAWPAIKEQVLGYARDTAHAVLAGDTVDVLHPTITAEDVTGRELVVADAKSRSWRTLVQGLIFDVFAAIVASIAVLTGLDPFVRETWIAFGILLLKSVVSAVISYFMRLRITPTMRTEGEKFAIAPLPRPMIDKERNHP
jgi:hypothetical protein